MDTRKRIVSCGSTDSRELARAHLPEAGDYLARIVVRELHGGLAQAGQPVGETGHGGAVVAVVLGAAGEQLLAEPLQRRFELLVAGEVQAAEAVDERREPVERALVDAVFAAVDGG